MKKSFKKRCATILSLMIIFFILTGGILFARANDGEVTPDNYVSLSVGENLVSRYYIDYSAYETLGGVSLRYTYNEYSDLYGYQEKTSEPVLFNTIDGDSYVITVAQAPAQIGESTEIEILDDSGNTIDTLSWSPKDYCSSIINMNASDLAKLTKHGDELVLLCKAMVMYSKAAQGVFEDYMTKYAQNAVAVNEDYTSDLELNSKTYTPSIIKNSTGDTEFRSVSYFCTSAAKLRFYLNISEDKTDSEINFTAPSGVNCELNYTIKRGQKAYYIEAQNIKPCDFDKKISVTVDGAFVQASVLDYAGSIILNSENSAMQFLAKSMISYYDQADAYFNAPEHIMQYFPAAEPTCTQNGNTEYYYCSECGGYFADADGNTEITSDDFTVSALGHNYSKVVTAPTCTEQGYITYTCSRCGETYTDNYVDATGHTESSNWVIKTASTDASDGAEVKLCSVCSEELSSRTVKKFTHKLVNKDSYLYRVGNGNTVTLGTLFDSESGADITSVTATVTNNAGNASGTFTANSDWRNSTLKFSGLGVVTVNLKHGNSTAATLNLEVVSGTNKTSGALGNISGSAVVLLGNVTANKSVISNKGILYGNGFTVTDNRTDTSGAGNYYIQMSGGATINNAILNGLVYTSAVTDGTSNQNYAPGLWITGNANIYNCHISETKNAVQIDSGTVVLENTTVSGGAIANIDIGGGNVTLKNCITSTSVRGGLKGLGIRPTSANCKINLEGTFTQYNWLTKSDLPSTYSTALSSVYSNSTYAYTYNSTTYANMGIFFVSGANNISESAARNCINDTTGNDYGYIEKTTAGITATDYTAKATMGSPSMLSMPSYSATTNGQYPVLPALTVDYTNKNYKAKEADSNTYCYYDSTTDKVNISFEEGDSKVWDTDILTVTKNGNSITPSAVTMNGTDYKGSSITFTDAGDYEVVYTYTDPYNYNADGTAYSVTYTKTISINVNIAQPDVVVYKAAFSYTGTWQNDAKQVIGTDNKTYVMPDVSATSSTIGKTTVAGQTVYYPIVTVEPTSSNGNTTYSSGKGYYFAPVFNAINITDYNQTTGAAQYAYNSSSTTWPHGKSSTAGPDTNYFTCASGEKTWSSTSPYARSMNSQYYGYGKNNNGLCYTSKEIEKDNTASTHLVQYHYVSNDGTTYYYYIQYSFSAMTYSGSGCVAEGTLVTMADGSKKPIEEVKIGDEVLTYSFFNGQYEAQPVALYWDHGKKDWTVVTLHFDDGSDIRTIYDHGYFDLDKNSIVYLNSKNVQNFVGDRFVKLGDNGENKSAVLTSYTITEENVGCYSILTAKNFNFITEDYISLTSEDNHDGAFEFFTVGENMKYDEDLMNKEIALYGLYTYDDFKDYLSEEEFDALNFKYFKVLVGKGVLTYEELTEMISSYVKEV